MRKDVIVYRGHTIQRFLRAGSGLWWVEKNGVSISYVRSVREGKHLIDSLIGADRLRIRKIRGNPSRITGPNSAVNSHIQVMVYGRVLRIEAQKTQPHRCDPDCAAVGHRYYHDFKNGAVMYGLENGDLLIRKVR
jgi:hypothetical protein